MISDRVRRIIQSRAGILFPAKELWFNDASEFLCFDVNNNKIFITSGMIKNKRILYKTQRIETFDIPSYLDNMLENIKENGYECYSIRT